MLGRWWSVENQGCFVTFGNWEVCWLVREKLSMSATLVWPAYLDAFNADIFLSGMIQISSLSSNHRSVVLNDTFMKLSLSSKIPCICHFTIMKFLLNQPNKMLSRWMHYDTLWQNVMQCPLPTTNTFCLYSYPKLSIPQ